MPFAEERAPELLTSVLATEVVPFVAVVLGVVFLVQNSTTSPENQHRITTSNQQLVAAG